MFPGSPALNDTAVVGRRVWIWDGDKWLQMPFSTTQLGVGTHPPTYALDVDGDCNLSAGSVYRIDGVPLNLGGSQTPWLSNIDAAQFQLNNIPQVNFVPATGTSAGSISINASALTIAASTANTMLDLISQFELRLSSRWVYVNTWLTTGQIFNITNYTTASVFQILANGNVGVGTSPGTYKLEVNGDVNIPLGNVYRINGVPLPGQTPWVSNIDGASYRLNSAGNIGIGTAASALDTLPLYITRSVAGGQVTGGSALQVQVDNQADSGSAGFRCRNSTSSVTCGIFATGTAYYPSAQAGCGVIYSITDLALMTGLAASASEHMRLTAAGDVCIGNPGPGPFSAPGFSHLVVGPAVENSACGIITACASTNVASWLVGQVAFANYARSGGDKRVATITALVDGSVDSALLQFETYQNGVSTPRMRITAAGDVGVGTIIGVGAVPSARLDIVGAGGDPGVNPVVRMGGVTGNVLELGAIQGAPFAVWLQTRDRSTPYGYPLLLNPLGGNVGIGMSNPLGPLHVSGSNSGILVSSPGADWAYYGIYRDGSTGFLALDGIQTGASGYVFRVDTTREVMRLLNNGDLYVGQNVYALSAYFGPISTGSAPILFCPNDVSTAPGQPPSTLCFSLNTAAHALFIQVRLGVGTYASAAIPLT